MRVRNRRSIIIVILILAVAIINVTRVRRVLSSFGVRTRQDIKFLKELRQNQTEFYSKARRDRSGAAIHDMLMAHSFAFHHNVSYKGACLLDNRRPRKETIRLQNEFDLNKIIPYACPHDEKMPYMLVETKLYRKFDSTLFTREWRNHVQALVKNPQSVEKFSQTETNNDNRPFRIAVHIRRGDVDPCLLPNRYLPNSHYLQLIDIYSSRRSNPNQPVHVTIFSERPSFENFNEFLERDYSVHLNSDVVKVWSGLISADVAILSRSSFSYVPAILNPNTVVYTPFWHRSLEYWDVVGADFMNKSLQEVEVLKEKACEWETYIKIQKKFWNTIGDIQSKMYFS